MCKTLAPCQALWQALRRQEAFLEEGMLRPSIYLLPKHKFFQLGTTFSDLLDWHKLRLLGLPSVKVPKGRATATKRVQKEPCP